MNVILVISDSLRRDHLACYGNTRVKTPHLSALAAKSAVFDKYYAGSFPTMPARADLTTGKLSMTFMTWEPLPEAEVPLSQRMREHGYTTVGVVDTPFYTQGGMGYDRGYHHFFDLPIQDTAVRLETRPLFKRERLSEYDYCAPQTFALAEQCLDRVRDRPFFMLVDTWDPHEPWDPPAWYLELYRGDVDRPAVYPPYGFLEGSAVTDDEMEYAHASYMAEITMVDRWVGRLMERLETLGIADDTAIIFTSDHGFYFGEHRGMFGKMIKGGGTHAQPSWLASPLYEELVHLPLIIHVPGQQGRRISTVASAIDVVPTILEIAGMESAEFGMHGSSLLSQVLGQPGRGADIVISGLPLTNPGQSLRVVDNLIRSNTEFQPVTISDGRWSLLYSAAGRPVELYDVAGDPHQLENVAADAADVVKDLHDRYVERLVRLGTADRLVQPRRSLD